MRAFVLNPSFLLFYHQLISTFYKFVIIGKCCLITQLPIAITHIPIKNEYIISFSGTSLIYDKDKNHLLTSSSRNRVITQVLWQIEGRTMFVAKWEPGVIPEKPELKSAPIWLELRNVPFQFFNEDGLERIAGLVGHPKFLHPSTANKTNLEVAKVFTIIDPRKPLPEAVNVQFDSGEISRVLVSSPWMPPICNHCKEIGHLSNRCKLAPITCVPCNSSSHGSHNCPKAKISEGKGRKTRRAKPKEKQWAVVDAKPQANAEQETTSKLGTKSDFATGECSKDPPRQNAITKPRGTLSEASSGVEPDSSDVESSEEEEEGEIMEHEDDFRVAKKKLFSKLKGERGKGLKHA